MREPWMLAGDFNDIAWENEKRGGAPISSRKCARFRDRMDACRLMDLGAMGPKFTWRGPLYHGGQRIYERLDRALSNDRWRLVYPDGFVKVLPRLEFSDHHPLLIVPIGEAHPRIPRQFKFESAWLLDESYSDMLREHWNDDALVSDNLSEIKSNVHQWKTNTFDKILIKKKRIMARLDGIQRALHNGNRNKGLWALEIKLNKELSETLQKEELMWFQRSRAKWLMDGDRNTRYYHLKTVNRRRRNNIVMLKDVNGSWVEDSETLQS
ncbi:hypothetical protein A2U01_0004223, partial [Trifolium medium]|nr:hypothetical protein [Trifolium medium]